MNTRGVSRVKYAFESLSGREFKPGDDYLRIAEYPWGGDYRPDARAMVEWDELGLRITLCAHERETASAETRFGGRVCEDSCLEFFVNPCPSISGAYVNFEVNPKGVMHIGAGDGRHGRRVLETPPLGLDISVSRHDGGWWAARFRADFALFIELCGGVERRMRANFYKCDESLHPHFAAWNAVQSPTPDFHRPECFGQIILE